MPLSLNELVLINIVLGALALIISNRFRPDIVAILVLLALAITGLVDVEEALSGFSRPVIIVLMGMFVITRSLEETGIVQWFSARIQRVAGDSEKRLIVVFMAASASMVLVMNVIAAGAVMLPAVLRVSRESGVRASKLLIPMAFGTLIGATATYFPTANQIISAILQENGITGLGMADFFPTGLPIVIAGLLYMIFIGRHLLPDNQSLNEVYSPLMTSRKLRQTYQLDERLWEVRVDPNSRLVNVRLNRTGIGAELGITIVAIWRGHHAILAPDPLEILQADDYLLVMGREERVRGLERWGVKVGRDNGTIRRDHDYSVDLTEVVIPPHSAVIGKTLKDLRFRNQYGLTSVALWREDHSIRTDVGVTPLDAGDALLMVGPVEKIRTLASDRRFLVLESSHAYQPQRREKVRWALAMMALVLVGAIVEVIPLALAVLTAWMGLVYSRTLSMSETYQSIEWRVIFMVAGMLPLSIAMINTGLATRIGDLLVATLAPLGPLALVAGLYTLSMLVTQIVGGQVTSLIVGPIAITAAIQAGIDPRAVGVATAIGCATGFLTPVAHPVNVLMLGPGGYKFGDFARVGLGLTLITFLMMLIMMYFYWGIR